MVKGGAIRLAALAASLLCFIGGFAVLQASDFDFEEPFTGIGLYFMGKAIFVGIVLYVIAERGEKHLIGEKKGH